ncbi:Urb2/Npa2 family-domain-containing protein [Melanogaster broomeanus]|nr:Urb2/Npa2 family-domain-containing protein [Melanogaster broomeanus]
MPSCVFSNHPPTHPTLQDLPRSNWPVLPGQIPRFALQTKGEVIGEWVLTQLGHAGRTRKDKDTGSASNHIADPEYWTLLRDVLTTSPSTAARPIKTWLLPLLNRTPLSSIVIELLSLHSSQVHAPARAALAVLWPLADKKMGIDALGECLGVVLGVCAEWECEDDHLAWISSAVVSSYKNTLANAGNKKKIYTSFLTTHLPTWLCAVSVPASSHSLPHITHALPKDLQDILYTAGTDTLFSLDALKQPLDSLFDALSSSPSLIASLLPVLPKLSASLLSATQKHRSALFPAATTVLGGREEVRKQGMEVVGRCLALVWGSMGVEKGTEVEAWKSVVGLLEIVERERLFVANFTLGAGVETGMANGEEGEARALVVTREKAITVLEAVDASAGDDRAELVALSSQVLDVLVQIEYDLVGGVLGRILAALINIPPTLSHLTKGPTSTLLAHLLEYHTKTRTNVIPAVLEAVEGAWAAYTLVRDKDGSKDSERHAKRRKAWITGEGSAASTVALAQACSYTGRVAGAILSNLPMNAYAVVGESALAPVWNDVGKLGWSIVWQCLREESETGVEQDKPKEKDSKKKRKHADATASSSTFASSHSRTNDTVASAALRFLYDVRARVSSPLGDCDRLGEADLERLMKVARGDGTEPELVLEITQAQTIITTILTILTAHFTSDSHWSGVSASLTHDNLGLAILFLLTDRWIEVVNALASAETLEKFVYVLLSIPLDLANKSAAQDSRGESAIVTPRSILLDVLRNAQFWELHNIRGLTLLRSVAVFMSSILTLTAPLSSYTLLATASESSSTAMPPTTELARASEVYRLLLHVPPEYFTRVARAELVRRAVGGDVGICAVLNDVADKGDKGKSKERDKSKGKPRRKSRIEDVDDTAMDVDASAERAEKLDTLSDHMGQFVNTSDCATSKAFVEHLLNPPSGLSSPSETLKNVTLGLIELHFVALLRSKDPEAASSTSSMIATLISTRPFSQPDSEETWTHILVQSSVLRLVERLRDDFTPTRYDPVVSLVYLGGNERRGSLPDVVVGELRTFHEALVSALSPHVNSFMKRDATAEEEFPSSGQIHAWCQVLSFTQWLGIRSVAVPFGLKLAMAMLRGGVPAGLGAEIRASVLALLFEELRCTPVLSHSTHLDLIVAFYSVNGADRGSEVERILDSRVSQASKKLSVEDFSHLLDTLAEGIGGSDLQACQRERLIHLSMVLLHDAPQGTLKFVQKFATRCFNLFTGRAEMYEGSSQLKVLYLEFLARHCSDRPAAIRSVDLGTIWSLLNKILSGSSEHDKTTSFLIFHHIVTTIGALVRLRRDLVIHTLPHLSLLLRQLTMLTRTTRPQLGAKQSKIVTDTFPSWISSSQPLSAHEGRALARLFTALTTKTVPRAHAHPPTSSTEPQKSESLAKPFAKHAGYVLISYIDALNDPLCVMTPAMRRELEPGLFALCEMVGEHSRDAIMLSALDSGGKTIMKMLWKEYEKQRYVGKG